MEPHTCAARPLDDEVPYVQAYVKQRSTLVLQLPVPLVVVGVGPRREVAASEAATAAIPALDDEAHRFIQLRDHLHPRPMHQLGAIEGPILPFAP